MNYRVGIHALVRKDGKFLVLKKSDTTKKDPGTWDLPGGSIERKEDPLTTVVRETKEEAGIDIKISQLLGVWAFETLGDWSVELIALGEATENNIILEEQYSEYKWVSLDELRKIEPKRNHLQALFKHSLIDLNNLK